MLPLTSSAQARYTGGEAAFGGGGGGPFRFLVRGASDPAALGASNVTSTSALAAAALYTLWQTRVVSIL